MGGHPQATIVVVGNGPLLDRMAGLLAAEDRFVVVEAAGVGDIPVELAGTCWADGSWVGPERVVFVAAASIHREVPRPAIAVAFADASDVAGGFVAVDTTSRSSVEVFREIGAAIDGFVALP